MLTTLIFLLLLGALVAVVRGQLQPQVAVVEQEGLEHLLGHQGAERALSPLSVLPPELLIQLPLEQAEQGE